MAEKLKRGFLKHYQKAIALGVILVMLATYVTISPAKAAGAAADTISDTLTDSRPGNVTEIVPNHTIKFHYSNAASVVTGNTETITFTGFTQGATASAVTDFVITAGTDGTTYGTTLTQTTDFTFGNSAGANPVYTFTWTATGAPKIVSNPYVKIVFTNATGKLPNPAAGTYSITLGGSGNWATGTMQVVILTSGVSVSATVDAYMTFTSDDYAIGFGTWTAGNTAKRWSTKDEAGATVVGSAVPVTLTVSTNAGGGASITAKSVNGQLTKSPAGDSIPAAASTGVSDASKTYGLYSSAVTGTFVIDEGFDNDTTSDLAISTTPQVIAASSANALNAATVAVIAVASINATTMAGAYSDTLVFVATATY